MEQPNLRTKIVTMLEPSLCQGCRFWKLAQVSSGGHIKTMNHCTRLDCDNWEIVDAAAPVQIIKEGQ